MGYFLKVRTSENLTTEICEDPMYDEGNFGEWKNLIVLPMTLKIQFKIGLIIH